MERRPRNLRLFLPRPPVAEHLLECSPQADPEVSEYLRLAACAAAPPAAARYLERALDERAPGDDRAGMLAALSTVSVPSTATPTAGGPGGAGGGGAGAPTDGPPARLARLRTAYASLSWIARGVAPTPCVSG